MVPFAHVLTAAVLVLAASSMARADVSFSDNFNAGASAQWGNERGTWSAAGGVYNAAAPNGNLPLTYSSLPFVVGDLTLDLDINDVSDGGFWLHADAAGQNGVLVITGGNGWFNGTRNANAGHSLYFQVMTNGSLTSQLSMVTTAIANPGVDDVHVHATVVGNLYTVTLGSTTISLTNSQFPTGRVGLYDSAEQNFDNVVLSAPTPEPTALALLGAGSATLLMRRRRRSA